MRTAVLAAILVGLSIPVADVAAETLGHDDVEQLARSAPDLLESYGNHPAQKGELRLPSGAGPFPVAIVVHGGCWTKSIGATESYMAPLASVLTAHGIATWNIDYRQVGDAGAGWPGTFEDWSAAADHLRSLAKRYPLDLSRAGVIGHSAGAHAAFFLAGRSQLPAGAQLAAPSPLPIHTLVALDGPGDLERGRARAAEVCGVDGIFAVMGGFPKDVPERYIEGSPVNLLPFGTRQLVVSSVIMTAEQGEAWKQAATASGDFVELIHLDRSGHFGMLAPGTASFEMLLPAFLRTLRGEPE